MNFDEHWRLESIKVAAMEQLEQRGELDLDVLFTRAKLIYEAGYELMIDKWSTEWSKDSVRNKKKPKPAEGGVITNHSVSTKQCPECGEDIPAGWTKHAYKKDGTPCGHTF
jgi:hypothetical protein